MKLIYILFFVFTFSSLCHGQQISLVTTLESFIEESSGLIYLDGKLITHNDSGGNPTLYELDDVSGNITRSVVIENAANTDWEDLCHDDTYIYIADFGNNNGTRNDLKIYRLPISDYLTTPNDTVIADTINFSYLDQTNFTPSTFSTNFDAEAIISCNDSLFIFTKNWGNNWTNIYALPKTPGTYQIEKIDSIDVQGLITGGSYDDTENIVLLSGYTFAYPFVIEINGFTSNDFSDGTVNRYPLDTPSGSSIQIEGITHFQANEYYLTAEAHLSGNPSLYKLEQSTININALDLNKACIYPNPTSNYIELKGIDFSVVEIYDAAGILRKTSHSPSIQIADLTRGVYFLVAKDSKGKIIFSKKLMIQ